jgi:hypothetical protein
MSTALIYQHLFITHTTLDTPDMPIKGILQKLYIIHIIDLYMYRFIARGWLNLKFRSGDEILE